MNGPWMVVVPVVSVKVRAEGTLIVLLVVNTVASNVMVSAPGLALAKASSAASEPVPLVLVLVTIKEPGTTFTACVSTLLVLVL